MPAPYSIDFRQKILDVWKSRKISKTKLAERFNVSLRFIQRFLKRYDKENTVEPKSWKRGAKPLINSSEHYFFIKNIFDENPGAELREACRRFEKRFETTVSASTMSRVLKRLKITRKKNFLRP